MHRPIIARTTLRVQISQAVNGVYSAPKKREQYFPWAEIKFSLARTHTLSQAIGRCGGGERVISADTRITLFESGGGERMPSLCAVPRQGLSAGALPVVMQSHGRHLQTCNTIRAQFVE